jgi:hypothetical protein
LRAAPLAGRKAVMKPYWIWPLALGLSACGGGVATTGAGTYPVSSTSRAPAGAEALMAMSGRPDAPGPEALIAALGRPDVDRREGAGAMLAWRLPDCALALGFANDARGHLRLSLVQADAPRPGSPAPTRTQCVASARARQAPNS